MRPAAARLADAAAHHQHVDDAAVVHVHVVPVVQAGADDDHRAALGLLGVERELARHRDDLVARHAGDLLRPGRRIGLRRRRSSWRRARRRSRDRRRNWRRTGRTPWRPAPRRRPVAVRLTGTLRTSTPGWSVPSEVVVLAIAEIGEADRRRRSSLMSASVSRSLVSLPVRGLFLEVPLALLAPAEADRAVRHHDRCRSSRR